VYTLFTRKELYMQKLMLEIDGMGCGACVRKVTDALNAVPSVRWKASRSVEPP
jgi:copper chaperone CopZ